jgi:Calcineurin-like phosphoesterase
MVSSDAEGIFEGTTAAANRAYCPDPHIIRALEAAGFSTKCNRLYFKIAKRGERMSKQKKKKPRPVNLAPSDNGQPQFGQPQPSPDPTSFAVPHPSDSGLYKKVNPRLLEPIPAPRDPSNLVLTLESVLGPAGPTAVKQIIKDGQIVFHSVGDTGSVKGPETQSLVADKLAADFLDEAQADTPAFLYHLGDVIYSFGEGKYYYDQFYEPYRNYPAPIVAIPGNHDGVVYSGDAAASLEAFFRNFVNSEPVHTADAAGLLRTAMIAPAVYFAFDAPFVSIVGLYSNVLEDPGVISSEGNRRSPVDDQQLTFLEAQMKRLKKTDVAVIVATHHPPYTGGADHVGSPRMLKDLDQCFQSANFWPHLVFSGHAHNFQRYTRTIGNFQTPYVVCGSGGHGLTKMRAAHRGPIRTPVALTKDVVLSNYDDQNYGYLRVVANASQIRVEFHDAIPGQTFKSPSDQVTVDLKSHTIIAS